MKIAVDFHSGPRIAAFTRFVTYDSPAVTSPGGCSLTAPVGLIHETAGSLPAFAALKYSDSVVMFCSSPSCWTVSKYGSGFQMPGVFAPCLTDSQIISSFSQSLAAREDVVAPADAPLVQQV